MKTHQEFRDTKIGKIPDEWEVVKLGDEEVTVLIMGQSPPSSTYNNAGIGLPFLQGNAEFGEMYPIPVLSCSHPIKITEKNDILLSVRAPVGDVNIAPFKSCIGRELAAIRPKGNKLDYFFLFYYLKLRSRLFESLSMGSTFKAIRKMEIEKFRVLLPPLPEQKKIAEILSTVDQAIEKVDEAIVKTKRVKKGLMQELLNKGIGHKEFKQTEIGRIPDEWKVVRLGDISLDLIGGGTPSTSNPGYWNGDVAWMTSAHINDREIKTGQRYITKEGLQNSATSVVPEGNLLVATRVGIGKAAINKIDIAISQDLTGIMINKNRSIPDFVYWCLINNKNRLKSLAQGSTIKGILRERLGNLRLPLPPLPEQKKIAEILSTVDKRIQLLRERKERLGRAKKGLMNDLLTGKRKVRLET